MSTPEHQSTPATTGYDGHGGEDATELEVRRATNAAIYAHATNPTRTTTVVSWIGWHITEIGGITVPALMGATWWGGFYAVSAAVAAGWAANEARTRRGQAKIRAARTTPTTQEKPGAAVSDEDGEQE